MDISKISKEDTENLRLEIKLHSKLNHPNVIRFIDYLQIGPKVYILLEYASNGCLYFYIDVNEGIPERLALRFLRDTASALKYLHSQGVIHRDIKPENILLDDQFNVKVCDFGWATHIQNEKEVRNSICGTLQYMPPEVCFRQTHSTKADMWSLGVLLYEMTHGRPPFEGESLDHLKTEFRSKNIEVRTSFSQEIRDLLRDLFRMDSLQRPNASQLLNHSSLTSKNYEISQPLTQEDFRLLIKTYMKNTASGKTMELAEVAEAAVKNTVQPPPVSRSEKLEDFFAGLSPEIENKNNKPNTCNSDTQPSPSDFFADIPQTPGSQFEIRAPCNFFGETNSHSDISPTNQANQSEKQNQKVDIDKITDVTSNVQNLDHLPTHYLQNIQGRDLNQAQKSLAPLPTHNKLNEFSQVQLMPIKINSSDKYQSPQDKKDDLRENSSEPHLLPAPFRSPVVSDQSSSQSANNMIRNDLERNLSSGVDPITKVSARELTSNYVMMSDDHSSQNSFYGSPGIFLKRSPEHSPNDQINVISSTRLISPFTADVSSSRTIGEGISANQFERKDRFSGTMVYTSSVPNTQRIEVSSLAKEAGGYRQQVTLAPQERWSEASVLSNVSRYQELDLIAGKRNSELGWNPSFVSNAESPFRKSNNHDVFRKQDERRFDTVYELKAMEQQALERKLISSKTQGFETTRVRTEFSDPSSNKVSQGKRDEIKKLGLLTEIRGQTNGTQSNIPSAEEKLNNQKFKYVVSNGLLVKKPFDGIQNTAPSVPSWASIPKSFSTGQFYNPPGVSNSAVYHVDHFKGQNNQINIGNSYLVSGYPFNASHQSSINTQNSRTVFQSHDFKKNPIRNLLTN